MFNNNVSKSNLNYNAMSYFDRKYSFLVKNHKIWIKYIFIGLIIAYQLKVIE